MQAVINSIEISTASAGIAENWLGASRNLHPSTKMLENVHTLIKIVAGHKNIGSRASRKNRSISKALDEEY